METLVCKKRSNTGSRMLSIGVGKLCEGLKVLPVVLLVVDKDAKVLFKDLVDSFGLAIGLGMVGRG